MTIWHLLKERTMSSSGVWSRNSAKQKKIFGPRSRICEVGVLRSVNLHEAQAGCQWEDLHRKALGEASTIQGFDSNNPPPPSLRRGKRFDAFLAVASWYIAECKRLKLPRT